MRTILKGLALTMLPEKMLQVIKEVHYARYLTSVSESDEYYFKVIKYLVNPGDYVVDIGANIGVYTKLLSELVDFTGRVYSIEPIPLTFKILRSNVRKLALNNVELINSAISDINGMVTMEVPLYKSGGENFYRAQIVYGITNDSLRHVRVESRTLDYLFSELPYNISFVKCDVEGHELQCIKGAINIINNSKPAWFIEVGGDPDNLRSTAYETFKLLNEKGYEAFWFDRTKLNRRCLGDKSGDYFFLASKHLQVLRERGFLNIR